MYKIPSDLQYFKVTSLDHHADVFINLPIKTLHYTIHGGARYFLNNLSGDNKEIFTILDIKNANIFVNDIVGYITLGAFPEVRSIEDLLKVIIALDKECVKKFGNKHPTSSGNSDFKVGDSVVILPRDRKESSYRPFYVDDMTNYAGKTAIIIDICTTTGSCSLDIDMGKYWWPREVLKSLKSTAYKETSKPKSESTSELNLFPTRKHYQLNFNY